MREQSRHEPGAASKGGSGPNPATPNPATTGRVLFGTCGWTDDSILRCGRFYPAGVKTADQRLEVYSRHFPCVEVDSSNYAIPRPTATTNWVSRVPPGFRFHFKAFGLFCHRRCPFSALPAEVKQLLQERQGAGGRQQLDGGGWKESMTAEVTLEQLGAEGEAAVWAAFQRCLEPVVKASRMGCVIFQFQLGFKPSPESRAHVEHCRRMLPAGLHMAVEFRSRAWFADPTAALDTATWLASLLPAGGVSLVAADELRHETYGAHGAALKAEVLPIAMQVTDPRHLYVRLHRRAGTTERLLNSEEVQAWAARLAQLCPQLRGPAYFLIGTDWEDAPINNAHVLEAALPPLLRYNWHAVLTAAAARRPGSIQALLSRAAAAPAGSAAAAAAEAVAAGNTGMAPAAAAVEAAPTPPNAAGDGGEPQRGAEGGCSKDRAGAEQTSASQPAASEKPAIAATGPGRGAGGTGRAGGVGCAGRKRDLRDFFAKGPTPGPPPKR